MADSPDIDVGLVYGINGTEYTTAVSTGDDGDFAVSIGKTTTDDEPATTGAAPPTDTPVADLVAKVKPYALPVGVALAFVLLAAALSGSKGGRA